MKNPWGNIPTTAPFVLADDAPYVEAFDAICDRTDGNDHKLDTNFPPSPFAGCVFRRICTPVPEFLYTPL
jgi:hypothetical protein